MRARFPILAILAAALLAAACTYRSAYHDNPVLRSASWFSYLNGDDLRAYCAGGGPDRYRFVYNAVWSEQVRTYDLTVDADGDGGVLLARVFGTPDLSEAIPLDDPLSPWRGTIKRTRLGRGGVQALRDALRESGFDTPAPEGLRLHSHSFFWIANACEGGRFRFNAWRHPSDRYRQLTLDAALKRVDPVDVAFNEPRALEPFAYENDPGFEHGERLAGRYRLRVGDNGLSGLLTPF